MSVVALTQAPEQCVSWYSWDSKVDFNLPLKEKFMQKETNASKFQILLWNAKSFKNMKNQKRVEKL